MNPDVLSIEGRAAGRTRAPGKGRNNVWYIVYQSRVMQQVMDMADKVAQSDSPVMILGETGTGKELIARYIHLNSRRKRYEFLDVNCASISQSLLENELFGHEKGSFTGADEQRRGLFELAHRGTLFMDEIGEMSVTTQSNLLRVLETGAFRRIGGETTLKTDVRLITATNKDLESRIAEKTFRDDLYYRLNTIVITLPPLRKRKDDIWFLAEHFLSVSNKQQGLKKHFAPDVQPIFERYHWSGNVRELKNTVERMVLLSEEDEIKLSDMFPDKLFMQAKTGESSLLPLEEVEKRYVLKVLSYTRGNRREAAGLLKISEPTLYRKIKEYNIKTENEGKPR
ncbi:MAG: sigma-54-dependent Fis family transcriptional regulator [Planctomycetes bacterium]|nr:sigma-54-dependent Fis family transcriptional regulator [Planctomycetota bacterium]